MRHVFAKYLLACAALFALAACGAQNTTTAPTTGAAATTAATTAPTAAATTAPLTDTAAPATTAPLSDTTTITPTAATVAPTAATTGTTTSGASGELVVYTSRSEALFKPVVDEFNKTYPDVKVTILSGGNGDLGTKILEERANPAGDVFINSDTLSMQTLAAEGAFEANASDKVTALPAAYRADDGSWAALTMRGRVIMYNTDLVTEAELPKSILDLTDPKWKGQVGSANSTNGAVVAHIVAMNRLLGAEKTEAFVKGLVDNETQFFGSHTDVRKAVGAGELKLGFVNHYYYFLSKAEGAPVGIIWPDQDENGTGLVVNTTNAGIIKGAKNMDNAKLFVDFMLSPEGQKVFAEKNFEWPVVEGVERAADVPAPTEYKIADIELKTLYTELDAAKELAQKVGMP